MPDTFCGKSLDPALVSQQPCGTSSTSTLLPTSSLILPSGELTSSTQQHEPLAAAVTCVPACSVAKGTGKTSGARAVAFLSQGPGSSHMSCLSSDGLHLAGENIWCCSPCEYLGGGQLASGTEPKVPYGPAARFSV